LHSRLGGSAPRRWAIEKEAMKYLIGLTIIIFTISCSATNSTNNSLAITPISSRTSINTTPNNIKMEGLVLIDGICDMYNCLFDYKVRQFLPMGLATLVGNYDSLTRTAYTETKQCNNFIIMRGNNYFIDSILSLINDGNGINTSNNLGQPIININIDLLTKDELTLLLASKNSHPISITIISKRYEPRSAPVCHSLFTVLNVYDYDVYQSTN
jgi:hypothetical protein